LAPQKPERDEWGTGLEALEAALQLEKTVNQALLDLHKISSEHGDPHVSKEVSTSLPTQKAPIFI
jgi:ferritin heavy chain